MTFFRVEPRGSSEVGRPALGYLCVRGARHPRVARAGPPIAVELGSPLYGGTRGPGPGYASGGRNRWPGASVVHARSPRTHGAA